MAVSSNSCRPVNANRVVRKSVNTGICPSAPFSTFNHTVFAFEGITNNPRKVKISCWNQLRWKLRLSGSSLCSINYPLILGSWIAFGVSLKWPFKELQFLSSFFCPGGCFDLVSVMWFIFLYLLLLCLWTKTINTIHVSVHNYNLTKIHLCCIVSVWAGGPF